MLLGEGAYGNVYLVRYKDNKKLYTIIIFKRKKPEKSFKNWAWNFSQNSKTVKFPFYDKKYLYIETEFVQDINFFQTNIEKKEGRLDLETTKFYAIELLLH